LHPGSASKPKRRGRRGGGPRKADQKTHVFADLANIQLERIQECVADMKAHNQVFEIIFENDTLTIDMGEENGSLVVIPDEKCEELTMNSPVR
jgi:hypothetical protein